MTTNGTSKSTGNPLLSEGAFQTEHSRKLFDALDKLRSCGANEHVDLPEVRHAPLIRWHLVQSLS